VALVLSALACGGDVPVSQGTSITETSATDGAAAVRGPGFNEALQAGDATLTFFHVPSTGFAYDDANGMLTGLTVELLRDFARFVAATHAIDVTVHWVREPLWADFYGYVRDSRGAAFGIGNVTITELRREELDFSPPYLRNIAVLVTHENTPELTSLDRIADGFGGLTALPYPGTLHEARLLGLRDRHFPAMPLRPVASNDELVDHLASGEGYFGYIDIYNYWRAREAGRPLRRHPVGDDGAETFGVILPHDSDWTPVIEAFFAADGGYVQSARFADLMRQHLGDELATLLR